MFLFLVWLIFLLSSQVNGSLVSSMSHQEVVKLIKCEFDLWICLPVLFFTFAVFLFLFQCLSDSVSFQSSHSWNVRSSDTTRTAPFSCPPAFRALQRRPHTQSEDVSGRGCSTPSTSTLALWAEQHPFPKNHWTQTTTGE